AEYPGEGVPGVGSELARKMITESRTPVEFRQTGSNAACRIGLTVEIQFDLRLQYQPLREVQIVIALDPSRDSASIANVKRRLKFEEIGSESWSADCCPRASWPGIETNTYPRLPIEITHPRNWPVVQDFLVSVLSHAVCDSSFRFDPQL